jgi:protein-L-isoaspartate(D-aspartate) O-methyltransferase
MGFKWSLVRIQSPRPVFTFQNVSQPLPEHDMFLNDLPRPRAEMVERLAAGYPCADPQVLEAMSQIPRHIFTERGFWHMAYSEASLPIGYGQTLSQPATILRALSALKLKNGDTVLEIGSGSGYLAAVASKLCRKVFGIERRLALVHSSRKKLGSLSIFNVQIGYGDGYYGWPAHAPYDAVLCSAFARSIPDEVACQVVDGGLVAAPVGEDGKQEFNLWRKASGTLEQVSSLFECSFVPMIRGGGTVHG